MKQRFFLIKIAGFAILCFIVMLLWNWLTPVLFTLPTINYLQSVGLVLLCRLLFGRFNPEFYNSENMRRNPMKEKWMKMSDDEREVFIKKIRERPSWRKDRFFNRNKTDNDDSSTEHEK
ncbi:hypothetical protein O2K51_07605 [Apibacter raozihei]|uniref:hypothetical protein n=1 Tax=Apibacter raozihei TaxID=2500547 RepID=UPI000FE32EE0|nr:hypothetical protein [Apibacter raozihei]